ncbi:MAG: hypothetical protein J2O46_11240 [Nocardioides sp.]|nr:hypothetical protein [Nocardioides sp.]
MTTQVRPQTRRGLALAGALVALALPALSACGSFDYATDRPNVISEGGFDNDSGVRVHAARIVSDAAGQGVFIATFTLNPRLDPATDGKPMPKITSISTRPGATRTASTTAFKPLQLAPNGLLNLSDPKVGGVPVTGDFRPGHIIPIKITFDTGAPAEMSVPVVAKCPPYDQVVPAGGASTAAATTDIAGAPAAGAAAAKPAAGAQAQAQAAKKKAKGKKAPVAAAATSPAAKPIAVAASPSASASVDPDFSCTFPPARLPNQREK